MLGVGIIGCGRITQYRHAPEYLENKQVNLLGFADTRTSQADLMVEKFGGKNYESIDKMLNDPAIELKYLHFSSNSECRRFLCPVIL